MVRLRQRFENNRLENVAAAVRAALEKLNLGRTIKAGQSVALTAGSRGIANIPLVLKTVATHLKDRAPGANRSEDGAVPPATVEVRF